MFESTRRQLFKRGVTIAGLGFAAGLSGCSGDGSGGGKDGGGAAQVTGSGKSNVEGLKVTATKAKPNWEGLSGDDGFAVVVTLKNTGDKVTTASHYGYELRVYDGNGKDITGFERGLQGTARIVPGKTGKIIAFTKVKGSGDSVAQYEVSVTCGGSPGDEAVYCGPRTTVTTRSRSVPGEADYPDENRGSVRKNEIDQLAILGWNSEIIEESDGNRRFVVTVAIKNIGYRETEISEYHWYLRYYDDDGTILIEELAGMTVSGQANDELAPGKTLEAELSLYDAFKKDPDAIARYEITLECGPSGGGVYCEF